MSALPQWEQAEGSVRETVIFEQALQYHTGMRCPHQSWRDMHQSRMERSQLEYVFSHLCG